MPSSTSPSPLPLVPPSCSDVGVNSSAIDIDESAKPPIGVDGLRDPASEGDMLLVEESKLISLVRAMIR